MKLCNPIMAIVRSRVPVDLEGACQALLAGGVGAVEITLPTPDSLKAIARLRSQLVGVQTIGCGTVTTPEEARAAVDSGAQFLVTPTLKLEVIEAAHALSVPIFPGAFSPTEILCAHDAGAAMVKVFPAISLGPEYIAALRGPHPELNLMPTGGVDRENIRAWLGSGATALGVGSSLVKQKWLEDGDWAALSTIAKEWTEMAARNNIATQGGPT